MQPFDWNTASTEDKLSFLRLCCQEMQATLSQLNDSFGRRISDINDISRRLITVESRVGTP